MTRAFLEELVLFLTPFALFALFVAFRRKNPFTREPWNGNVPWLAIAGLGVAVAFLLYTGIFAPRQRGAFVPTHMENGKLVPGQFR
jgi:hypothetical protein